MSVLERIIAYKRAEVMARKRAKPWAKIEAEAHDTPDHGPRHFHDALNKATDRPALIAETLVMLYRRRRKPADQQA